MKVRSEYQVASEFRPPSAPHGHLREMEIGPTDSLCAQLAACASSVYTASWTQFSRLGPGPLCFTSASLPLFSTFPPTGLTACFSLTSDLTRSTPWIPPRLPEALSVVDTASSGFISNVVFPTPLVELLNEGVSTSHAHGNQPEVTVAVTFRAADRKLQECLLFLLIKTE